MKKKNQPIKVNKIPHLFVFGMYRSGTTAIARLLAGENKIAFSSDPIRPFFNWYRSILQKDIGYADIDDYTRPLGDYFEGDLNYIKKLISSKFLEKVNKTELINIRENLIHHGQEYSPKFIHNLKQSKSLSSLSYADELKYYLDLILKTYGNNETCIVGLKEVWSIEMALPIINMIGEDAKILIVIRDPLDTVASSFTGSNNYCILSLVRQWRKQIVFYNFLKNLFPNQVTSINYEEFCIKPEILKSKIEKLIDNSENILSDKFNLSDDYGNSWMKNSSYKEDNPTSLIDNRSIGKYLKVLNKPQIEWIIYLTHMTSYTKYNRSKEVPPMPTNPYPKKTVNNIPEWSKIDILKLEGNNLDQQLQLEYNRIKKISKFGIGNKINENNLISQI